MVHVFQKEFFKKVDFRKYKQMTKKHEKLPSRQRVERDSNPNDKYVLSERTL